MTDSPTVCDFCSDPDPLWSYPCEDFQLISTASVGKTTLMPGYQSVGPWLACAVCSFFIDLELWNRMRDHAAVRYATLHPTMIGAVAKALIEASHQGFREHVSDEATKEPWPND